MLKGSRKTVAALAACVLLAVPAAASAQAMQPAGTAEQRQAMQALSWMDGEWVGQATVSMGPGQTSTHPHTERIGPMLGGSIRVIEGRSVNADGFRWTTPARGGEMRYVTTFKDGEWVEIGHFVMPGREPMPVIELRLRRRGDTGWPAADPVIP